MLIHVLIHHDRFHDSRVQYFYMFNIQILIEKLLIK